jgi:hypothetical protein
LVIQVRESLEGAGLKADLAGLCTRAVEQVRAASIVDYQVQ